MKNTRLTAASAAALIATGLAVATAGPATAAPAKAERITSAQQLHESLRQAIAVEQTQNGALSGNPVGQASSVAPAVIVRPAC